MRRKLIISTVDISFLVHVFNFSYIYIWVLGFLKTRLFCGFVCSRIYHLVHHCIFMSRRIMVGMNLIWYWLKVAACVLFWCLFGLLFCFYLCLSTYFMLCIFAGKCSVLYCCLEVLIFFFILDTFSLFFFLLDNLVLFVLHAI